jgi:hypothetical protein
MSAVEVRARRPLAPKSLLLFGSLVVVALWVVAFVVIEGIGNSPDSGEGQALLRYFQEDEISLYAGGTIFFLGSILFIWWISVLRSFVADYAGESWLAGALYGSGIATAILSMGFVAPQFGAGFAANEDEAQFAPAAAQALWWAGDGFFIATAYAGAFVFISLAIVARRFRLLPVWTLALIGLGVLLMIIPGINWLGVIFGIPISVLLTGVFLREGPRNVEPAA